MAEMTPRQRWLALLNRQDYDRVPTDYWATPELHNRLKQDLNCATDDELFRKLHIDRIASVGPRCKQPHHPDDPKADVWGVRCEVVNYGTGVYHEAVHHPLANIETVEQVHAFKWPTADLFDHSVIADQLAKDDGYRCMQAGGFEPFLLYCSLRGMEQAYEDLVASPDIAEAIFQHIFDFHYEMNRRTFEAGKGRIDMTYVAEDLGSQTSPLFSLDLYRQFLMPRQKKMADLAKSFGLHVFYHTDGAAKVFLPDLIDTVGIEVLNPIQWRCPTMEREGLVKDFGQKIAFHGGIDNQQTLPFGTVDDVTKEVKECAGIFKDARWICAPCHNMQAVTPTVNVVAMYETIWAIGARKPGQPAAPRARRGARKPIRG